MNEAQIYAGGYADGLVAGKSLSSPNPDPQVLSFANALDALALHCANIVPHKDCVECETAMILARVVSMGNRMIGCRS